jgi:hypothetical protein
MLILMVYMIEVLQTHGLEHLVGMKMMDLLASYRFVSDVGQLGGWVLLD